MVSHEASQTHGANEHSPWLSSEDLRGIVVELGSPSRLRKQANIGQDFEDSIHAAARGSRATPTKEENHSHRRMDAYVNRATFAGTGALKASTNGTQAEEHFSGSFDGSVDSSVEFGSVAGSTSSTDGSTGGSHSPSHALRNAAAARRAFSEAHECIAQMPVPISISSSPGQKISSTSSTRDSKVNGTRQSQLSTSTKSSQSGRGKVRPRWSVSGVGGTPFGPSEDCMPTRRSESRVKWKSKASLPAEARQQRFAVQSATSTSPVNEDFGTTITLKTGSIASSSPTILVTEVGTGLSTEFEHDSSREMSHSSSDNAVSNNTLPAHSLRPPSPGPRPSVSTPQPTKHPCNRATPAGATLDRQELVDQLDGECESNENARASPQLSAPFSDGQSGMLRNNDQRTLESDGSARSLLVGEDELEAMQNGDTIDVDSSNTLAKTEARHDDGSIAEGSVEAIGAVSMEDTAVAALAHARALLAKPIDSGPESPDPVWYARFKKSDDSRRQAEAEAETAAKLQADAHVEAVKDAYVAKARTTLAEVEAAAEFLPTIETCSPHALEDSSAVVHSSELSDKIVNRTSGSGSSRVEATVKEVNDPLAVLAQLRQSVSGLRLSRDELFAVRATCAALARRAIVESEGSPMQDAEEEEKAWIGQSFVLQHCCYHSSGSGSSTNDNFGSNSNSAHFHGGESTAPREDNDLDSGKVSYTQNYGDCTFLQQTEEVSETSASGAAQTGQFNSLGRGVMAAAAANVCDDTKKGFDSVRSRLLDLEHTMRGVASGATHTELEMFAAAYDHAVTAGYAREQQRHGNKTSSQQPHKGSHLPQQPPVAVPPSHSQTLSSSVPSTTLNDTTASFEEVPSVELSFAEQLQAAYEGGSRYSAGISATVDSTDPADIALQAAWHAANQLKSTASVAAAAGSASAEDSNVALDTPEASSSRAKNAQPKSAESTARVDIHENGIAPQPMRWAEVKAGAATTATSNESYIESSDQDTSGKNDEGATTTSDSQGSSWATSLRANYRSGPYSGKSPSRNPLSRTQVSTFHSVSPKRSLHQNRSGNRALLHAASSSENLASETAGVDHGLLCSDDDDEIADLHSPRRRFKARGCASAAAGAAARSPPSRTTTFREEPSSKTSPSRSQEWHRQHMHAMPNKQSEVDAAMELVAKAALKVVKSANAAKASVHFRGSGGGDYGERRRRSRSGNGSKQAHFGAGEHPLSYSSSVSGEDSSSSSSSQDDKEGGEGYDSASVDDIAYDEYAAAGTRQRRKKGDRPSAGNSDATAAMAHSVVSCARASVVFESRSLRSGLKQWHLWAKARAQRTTTRALAQGRRMQRRARFALHVWHVRTSAAMVEYRNLERAQRFHDQRRLRGVWLFVRPLAAATAAAAAAPADGHLSNINSIGSSNKSRDSRGGWRVSLSSGAAVRSWARWARQHPSEATDPDSWVDSDGSWADYYHHHQHDYYSGGEVSFYTRGPQTFTLGPSSSSSSPLGESGLAALWNHAVARRRRRLTGDALRLARATRLWRQRCQQQMALKLCDWRADMRCLQRRMLVSVRKWRMQTVTDQGLRRLLQVWNRRCTWPKSGLMGKVLRQWRINAAESRQAWLNRAEKLVSQRSRLLRVSWEALLNHASACVLARALLSRRWHVWALSKRWAREERALGKKHVTRPPIQPRSALKKGASLAPLLGSSSRRDTVAAVASDDDDDDDDDMGCKNDNDESETIALKDYVADILATRLQNNDSEEEENEEGEDEEENEAPDESDENANSSENVNHLKQGGSSESHTTMPSGPVACISSTPSAVAPTFKEAIESAPQITTAAAVTATTLVPLKGMVRSQNYATSSQLTGTARASSPSPSPPSSLPPPKLNPTPPPAPPPPPSPQRAQPPVPTSSSSSLLPSRRRTVYAPKQMRRNLPLRQWRQLHALRQWEASIARRRRQMAFRVSMAEAERAYVQRLQRTCLVAWQTLPQLQERRAKRFRVLKHVRPLLWRWFRFIFLPGVREARLVRLLRDQRHHVRQRQATTTSAAAAAAAGPSLRNSSSSSSSTSSYSNAGHNRTTADYLAIAASDPFPVGDADPYPRSGPPPRPIPAPHKAPLQQQQQQRQQRGSPPTRATGNTNATSAHRTGSGTQNTNSSGSSKGYAAAHASSPRAPPPPAGYDWSLPDRRRPPLAPTTKPPLPGPGLTSNKSSSSNQMRRSSSGTSGHRSASSSLSSFRPPRFEAPVALSSSSSVFYASSLKQPHSSQSPSRLSRTTTSTSTQQQPNRHGNGSSAMVPPPTARRPGYAAQHAVNTELQAMGARRRRADAQRFSHDRARDHHHGDDYEGGNGDAEEESRFVGQREPVLESSEAWARASLRSSFQGASSLLSASFDSNGF